MLTYKNNKVDKVVSELSECYFGAIPHQTVFVFTCFDFQIYLVFVVNTDEKQVDLKSNLFDTVS